MRQPDDHDTQEHVEYLESEGDCSPKIIQILIAPNDSTWQGILLGLGDDGITYQVGTGAKWEPMIPPINSLENSLVSPQNEQ